MKQAFFYKNAISHGNNYMRVPTDLKKSNYFRLNTGILFLSFLFWITISQAQDFQIVFAGSGASNSVGTVKVENLTQGKSITVKGTEVLHLKATVTGLNPFDNVGRYFRIYPNPSMESSTIDFSATAPGNAIIELFDITGKRVCKTQNTLVAGTHSFNVDGLKRGIYVLKIFSGAYSYTGKLVCNGTSSSEIQITNLGMVDPVKLKSAKTETVMQYTTGDRLKFTGTSGIYSTILTDIPTQSKTITFNFVPCFDADGNSYPTVKIGTQIWMAENLKTTIYRNGAPIGTTIPAKKDISKEFEPRYQWSFNGDESNVATYGRLYTWYAATDSRQIAPVGWHVATDAEWTTLTNYLGGEKDAGGKLKETGITHWLSPNNDATNETGLTALPGGFCSFMGGFFYFGTTGSWWSASEHSAEYSWCRDISYNLPEVKRDYGTKKAGYSILCVKDEVNTGLAIVTTSPVSDLTTFAANSGGSITSDGGSPVSSRGICYSTQKAPDITSAKTNDGAGIGDFVSRITGLSQNTKYYVRAYAVNQKGVSYGNVISFTTPKIESLINCEQAYPGAKGEIADAVLNGVPVKCQFINGKFIYQGDIKIKATKSAVLQINSTLWPENKIYYTINNNLPVSNRITSAIKEFEDKTNLTFIPRINESNYMEFVFDENGCAADLGMTGGRQTIEIANWGTTGNVIHEIGHAISLIHEHSKKGRDEYITINVENIEENNKYNFEEDKISTVLAGFDFNSLMLYYSYAFSVNNQPTITKKDGTTYDTQRLGLSKSDIELIDLLYPPVEKLIVTTTKITNDIQTSVTLGGEVKSSGILPVIERGICYGTSPNPTIDNAKTSSGEGTGVFTATITGLTTATRYYFRAYATTSMGTTYGNLISNSGVIPPTLTATLVFDVTAISARCTSTVSDDGGAWLTATGICWSTKPDPTINDSKTNEGSFFYSFGSLLKGLSHNTTYYARAYASNPAGITYGTTVTFTTLYGDIDDNGYHTVTIGSQVWMLENLKTTRYNDGTPIPNVTDNGTWVGLTSGAFCWYANYEQRGLETYGALYNWFAISSGKLCPKGWHIPSEAEWITLINYLGGEKEAGDKMKSSINNLLPNGYWYGNGYGSNSSGFTGFPGGYRSGGFMSSLTYGVWGSTTEENATDVKIINLRYDTNEVLRYSVKKYYGLSVRCIKD